MNTPNQRIISAGVPQGSVLSPTLYSICTSDFEVLKANSLALYADDTAILTTGKVSNAIVKKLKKGCSTRTSILQEVENKD